MISDEVILKQAQAAIEAEPRINSQTFPLHMQLKDGTLVLDGEVESVAAKRLAAHLASGVDGIHGISDQIQVVSANKQTDGEILESLTQLLLGQIDLKNCSLRRIARSRVELLRKADQDDRCGDITLSVADGTVMLEGYVISLSHQRLAEVLAWWVPGSRNVVNRLSIMPAERDTDDEVSDAVHLALEMDPFLPHADQISVSTSDGVVTLGGAAGSDDERRRAEFDAWCVLGVHDVENRMQIAK